MHASIPSTLARALRLESYKKYPGSPRDDRDWSIEGHTSRGRFTIDCEPHVVELVIEDLARVAGNPRTSSVMRLQCSASIEKLRAAIKRYAFSPESPPRRKASKTMDRIAPDPSST